MLNRKARKMVRDYCDRTYPRKLEVVCRDQFRPLMNHRCHYNADAAVRQGDAVAIVECVMLDSREATLHYVSLLPDMTVFDGTLGPLYAGADYRLIQVIREFPDHNPDAQLTNAKRKLAKEALPKWVYALTDPLNLS